ncbi:MAG: ABC transporter permease [Roseitalea sp.]|nr:ABC transporter permease [Roseitalea sp.]MBO6953826.1 ABC transporter permease [Rhizobiaceae bacterium]MBO6594153.1 ABC transporter permease [Roseitalea sp.]MBO6601533.1 ABC transporter permease [Roseitalea sp.]MBO6613994.1 ABC transporter permease [Roseitalea sp.]
MVGTVNVSISVASVVAVLILWQVSSGWLIDPFFLPSPVSVVAALWEMAVDGTMAQSVGISVYRIMAGWLLGSAVAVPLGLLVGTFRPVQSLFDPFVHFFRFIPAIALVTLFIVWFGIGEVSKILLIAYATGFTVLVNTASGIGAIAQDKVDAARCLGADRVQVFFRVIFPASLPNIYVGMRLALANSFLVIVAAEMLAANSGLGYLIWNSRLFFRIDLMFGAIVLLGLLGFLADRMMRVIGKATMERYLRDVLKY